MNNEDVKMMTFDEAIEHFRNNTDISGTAVFLDDVEDTLKELREEYAPMVEMTKVQHELFSKVVGDEIGDQEELDAFVNEELDLGDMTGRDAIAHWLRPETIKVVDE